MSFQVNIKSSEEWSNEILSTPGLLQVVEIYQSWSGPCRAIQSTFKRIYFDNADSPLKFYTADATAVPELKAYVGSCEPVFILYKEGKELDKIIGVKGPELQKKILQLLDGM